MPTIQGQVQTYEINGRPRDLTDMITLISPTETPFFTAIGNGDKASQTLHEWQHDELADPGDNAKIEGADVTAFTGTNTVELFNRTQIFEKSVNVSGTAQAIKQAGVSRQYNRQVALRSKELKRDIEYAFLGNHIAAAGSATTPRRMRGLPAWITSNAYFGAGGAPATQTSPAVAGTKRALTHDLIAQAMQDAYTKGGDPSILMAAPAIRSKLTQVLKTVNVQDEEASEKRVTATVRIYEGDFGEVKVVPNRVQAFVPFSKDALFILDSEYWKKSYLRNITESKLAKTGDSDKGMLVGELTLEARAEESSAMIADIDPEL